MKFPYKVEVSRSTELDRWIAERHYLGSTPAGARLRLWVLDESGERGAMMWGRPVSRNIDQKNVLELTRMYMVDHTNPFAESKALSLARKYIRTHMNEIKGLIAYSSLGYGHEGTTYQADGWFEIARTKERKQAKGWSNRDGREYRDAAEKTQMGANAMSNTFDISVYDFRITCCRRHVFVGKKKVTKSSVYKIIKSPN